jgi:hypothetical protein
LRSSHGLVAGEESDNAEGAIKGVSSFAGIGGERKRTWTANARRGETKPVTAWAGGQKVESRRSESM